MKKDNKDEKGKAIHYAEQASEIHSNNSFIFSQRYAMWSLNPNSISSYGCHGKRPRYANCARAQSAHVSVSLLYDKQQEI